MKLNLHSTVYVALCVAFGAIANPAAADPSSVPASTWLPDGPVNAFAVSGSTLYLGGQFSRVAPYTGGFAALNPGSGQLQRAWPDVSGRVQAVVSDGAGGWYIGGSFSAVDGIARQNLARVRGDGTVDPLWAPTTSNDVRSLVRHGPTIFAGGSFGTANGVARNRIAAFDQTSGALRAFSGGVSGAGARVETLAVSGILTNPTLYVGGAFSSANGVPRRNLASFGINDSVLRAFDPQPDNEVLSLAVTGTTAYVAGDFTTVNGSVPRRHLAAFDVTNGLARRWASRPAAASWSEATSRCRSARCARTGSCSSRPERP